MAGHEPARQHHAPCRKSEPAQGRAEKKQRRDPGTGDDQWRQDPPLLAREHTDEPYAQSPNHDHRRQPYLRGGEGEDLPLAYIERAQAGRQDARADRSGSDRQCGIENGTAQDQQQHNVPCPEQDQQPAGEDQCDVSELGDTIRRGGPVAVHVGAFIVERPRADHRPAARADRHRSTDAVSTSPAGPSLGLGRRDRPWIAHVTSHSQQLTLLYHTVGSGTAQWGFAPQRSSF